MNNKELTCSQVMALISFYLDDKLSPKLREFVENHLKYCQRCKHAYEEASASLNKEIYCTQDESLYQSKQYEVFRENISAYVDNELDDENSLRIKKISITNPLARKDLQDMYTFKKMLQESFDKTKNEMRIDYSRRIIDNLSEINQIRTADFPYRLVSAFTVIMCFAVVGFLIMLYS